MKANYKRMLAGMEKGGHKANDIPEFWFVYILKCSDGTFYTGITNNLERRIKQHNEKKGAKYTRTRGPVTLLSHETCPDRSSALIRECKVKALKRPQKERLVTAPTGPNISAQGNALGNNKRKNKKALKGRNNKNYISPL